MHTRFSDIHSGIILVLTSLLLAAGLLACTQSIFTKSAIDTEYNARKKTRNSRLSLQLRCPDSAGFLTCPSGIVFSIEATHKYGEEAHFVVEMTSLFADKFTLSRNLALVFVMAADTAALAPHDSVEYLTLLHPPGSELEGLIRDTVWLSIRYPAPRSFLERVAQADEVKLQTPAFGPAYEWAVTAESIGHLTELLQRSSGKDPRDFKVDF